MACGRKRPHRGPAPRHELLIFADSVGLPEDYSSLHQNGGRGIRYHRAGSQEAQDAIQAYETVFTHTPRNGMKSFDELINHYTRAYPAVSDMKAIYLKRQAEIAKADDRDREYVGTLTPAQREERRIDREKRYADAIAAIPSQASTLGVIPPALQPKYMTNALAPYQKSGLQVPLEEFHKRYVVYDGDQVHNIGPAIDYLKKNVLGFFVAMPLEWGSGTKVDGDPTSGPAWIDLGKAPEPPAEVKPA